MSPLKPCTLDFSLPAISSDAEPVDDTGARSEGDSSYDSDLSVVKIVSDDPWAAAILKQVGLRSYSRVSLLIPSVA